MRSTWDLALWHAVGASVAESAELAHVETLRRCLLAGANPEAVFPLDCAPSTVPWKPLTSSPLELSVLDRLLLAAPLTARARRLAVLRQEGLPAHAHPHGVNRLMAARFQVVLQEAIAHPVLTAKNELRLPWSYRDAAGLDALLEATANQAECGVMAHAVLGVCNAIQSVGDKNALAASWAFFNEALDWGAPVAALPGFLNPIELVLRAGLRSGFWYGPAAEKAVQLGILADRLLDAGATLASVPVHELSVLGRGSAASLSEWLRENLPREEEFAASIDSATWLIGLGVLRTLLEKWNLGQQLALLPAAPEQPSPRL